MLFEIYKTNSYLNGTWINNFSEDWQDIIAITSWKIGEIDWNTGATYMFYEREQNLETTYDAKIALPYVSDWGYASLPEYWIEGIFNGFVNFPEWAGNNWYGSDFVFLNKVLNLQYVFGIMFGQGLSQRNYFDSDVLLYPTFYLVEGALFNEGTGSYDNPFQLLDKAKISFEIDWHTYYAYNNMTWKEWANSSFNTSGYLYWGEYGLQDDNNGVTCMNEIGSITSSAANTKITANELCITAPLF